MNEQTAMLEKLKALDGSLSLQVEVVLSMMRIDNVDTLMDALPNDFHDAFINWVRNKYQGGANITIGSSSTSSSIEVGIRAMRDWLSRHSGVVISYRTAEYLRALTGQIPWGNPQRRREACAELNAMVKSDKTSLECFKDNSWDIVCKKK